jgi:hypothetical protein
METEAGAPPAAQRPRPLLLILLGVAVVAFVLMKVGTSAPPSQLSGAVRTPRQPAAEAKLDPTVLDVHLEALSSDRPGPGEVERNPFRFQPRALPPAPPMPGRGPMGESGAGPAIPQGPPPPPPPPPITVKFIGTLDLPDGTRVAIFTDCTVGRRTTPVREGGTILGQYRLVQIGLQSVVVEHLDGRGRTTLPKGGQDCVK